MTQYWISTDPEVLGTSLQADSPEQAAALARAAHRLIGDQVTVRWNLQVRAGEPDSAYWMCSSAEVDLPRSAAVTSTGLAMSGAQKPSNTTLPGA